MAKKAQATKKSAEQAVSISRLKLNQLFFESLLIIQGFLGLFVLISLITFSPQDPGWNSHTFSNSLIGEEIGISNAVGSWGAYLSDFLFSIVGYMAYLLPYWLLCPLVRHFIFFRRPIQFSQVYSGLIGIRILGWSLFLISSATLLSIFIEPGYSFLPEDTGGLIGTAVSSYTLEPLSFIASANCILYSNARPDFADIDKETFTIDPNCVEDKIKFYKKKGKKIRSIVGIDYAGHPCDWLSLRYLANKHNISLVYLLSHFLIP